MVKVLARFIVQWFLFSKIGIPSCFHENYLHGLVVFPTDYLLILKGGSHYEVEKQNHSDWIITFNIIDGKTDIWSPDGTIARTQHHLCGSLTDNT